MRTVLYRLRRVKSERCVKLDGSKLGVLLVVVGRSMGAGEHEAGLQPLSGTGATT